MSGEIIECIPQGKLPARQPFRKFARVNMFRLVFQWEKIGGGKKSVEKKSASAVPACPPPPAVLCLRPCCALGLFCASPPAELPPPAPRLVCRVVRSAGGGGRGSAVAAGWCVAVQEALVAFLFPVGCRVCGCVVWRGRVVTAAHGVFFFTSTLLVLCTSAWRSSQ